LRLPAPSQHVRIDSGVIEGDTVSIFYDPMIAKLIVWDADRPRALARLREALAHCEIIGPKSNVAFLERLARHPAVVEGRIDTGYLDRHLDEFLPSPQVGTTALLAAASACLLTQESAARAAAARTPEPDSPWALADGWRLGHAGARMLTLRHRDHTFSVRAAGHAGQYQITVDGACYHIEGARLDDDVLSLRIDGVMHRVRTVCSENAVLVHDGQQRLLLDRVDDRQRHAGAVTSGDDQIRAPMPGRVVLVQASAGASVRSGDVVLVLEAMKMELALKAPRDGTLAEVRVQAGDFVDADAVLALLE
jgi:3-methylcrotonyl-CoA carboxylase alpha subunit